MITKCTTLLIIALLGVPVAKDISLSYDLRENDRFELRQKTEQKVVQTIMGMNQTGNNAYDGIIDMRVVSVQSGSIRLEAKMTRLKSQMKNFMNEVNMDSEGNPAESSTKILRAMLNKPFFITMTRSGVIEKVENVDNLWSDVDKLELSESDKAKVKATIGQMINESSFKNGLGQAFLTYAPKPVQLKETWTTQSGIPADFPVRVDNKWLIESATSSHAVVSGDGVFHTTDKDKVVLLPGDMKAKVNLSGTQKVTGNASIRTGLPDKVGIEGRMSGTILLLAGGLLPMDVEVPINIETNTSYTFARK